MALSEAAMTLSRNAQFDGTHLAWTTTAVEVDILASVSPGTHACAVSASAGILVYQDIAGTVRQILEAEFQNLNIVHGVNIAKLLTSGTVGGSTVTTTATNVRVWW
jgi:hypothetical protein